MFIIIKNDVQLDNSMHILWTPHRQQNLLQTPKTDMIP